MNADNFQCQGTAQNIDICEQLSSGAVLMVKHADPVGSETNANAKGMSNCKDVADVKEMLGTQCAASSS